MSFESISLVMNSGIAALDWLVSGPGCRVPARSCRLKRRAAVAGSMSYMTNTLSASGLPRATGEMRLSGTGQLHVATGTVAITSAVYGAASVVSHSPLAEVWDRLLSMSTSQVLGTYAALAATIREALSDPRTFGVALVMALPLLALVIRRLNLRR
jgi:hypothetical protein